MAIFENYTAESIGNYCGVMVFKYIGSTQRRWAVGFTGPVTRLLELHVNDDNFLWNMDWHSSNYATFY
jgi:hypothetical protein